MITLSGTVEGIIYRNEENGYTVFVFSTDDGFETVTGAFPLLREGDFIIVCGDYVEHDTYGTQFKAVSYEIAVPRPLRKLRRIWLPVLLRESARRWP